MFFMHYFSYFPLSQFNILQTPIRFILRCFSVLLSILVVIQTGHQQGGTSKSAIENSVSSISFDKTQLSSCSRVWKSCFIGEGCCLLRGVSAIPTLAHGAHSLHHLWSLKCKIFGALKWKSSKFLPPHSFPKLESFVIRCWGWSPSCGVSTVQSLPGGARSLYHYCRLENVNIWSTHWNNVHYDPHHSFTQLDSVVMRCLGWCPGCGISTVQSLAGGALFSDEFCLFEKAHFYLDFG